MTRITTLLILLFVLSFPAAALADESTPSQRQVFDGGDDLANYDRAVIAFDRADYEIARQILTPLAVKGLLSAQVLLGDLLATGKGVPRDLEEALKWYGEALGQRFQPAVVAKYELTWSLLREQQDRRARIRKIARPHVKPDPGSAGRAPLSLAMVLDIVATHEPKQNSEKFGRFSGSVEIVGRINSTEWIKIIFPNGSIGFVQAAICRDEVRVQIFLVYSGSICGDDETLVPLSELPIVPTDLHAGGAGEIGPVGPESLRAGEKGAPTATNSLVKTDNAITAVHHSAKSREEKRAAVLRYCRDPGYELSYITKDEVGCLEGDSEISKFEYNKVVNRAVEKFDAAEFVGDRRTLEACAKSGTKICQFKLGASGVRAGHGAEAAEWLRIAAESGDVNSQAFLGFMSLQRQDYVEAESWFRKTAVEGDSRGQYGLGKLFEIGGGVPQDHFQAAKWYRLAAEDGLMEAGLELGLLFTYGRGVNVDYSEALKWFGFSGEQALEPAARTIVGQGFEYGEGGAPQDYVVAAKWYELAAEQGDAEAQNGLGRLSLHGSGVTQSDSEAMKWFRLAAEQGLVEAKKSLGLLHLAGRGVPQNYSEGERLMREAATAGDSIAAVTLGLMLEVGEGVEQSFVEAAKWYQKAVDDDLLVAYSMLAGLYVRGDGVAKDYVEAAGLYRIAAEQGDAEAQNGLGTRYELGEGVQRDYQQAERWYRLAAEQLNDAGQFSLGYLYEEGLGVPQDFREALKWYRLAAAQNNDQAQFFIGLMYAEGRGVRKDKVEAHKWFNLAAARGNEAALEARNEVAAEMTAAEITDAQHRASGNSAKLESQERATPSVDTARDSSERSHQLDLTGTGTGFVVSKESHVITNNHVIESCEDARVGLPGSPSSDALVRFADENNDLAVLTTNVQFENVASFRSGSTVRQGDQAIVYGFPYYGALASHGNLTDGRITALAGLANDTRVMQISAPVQSGNSGGPLLDSSGNVIGVVTSKIDAIKVANLTGEIPQNVNFAIKASVVRTFLDSHDITYDVASSNRSLSAADVADRAKQFTVLVECWN